MSPGQSTEYSANATDLKHVLLKLTAMTTEFQAEFSIGLNGCDGVVTRVVTHALRPDEKNSGQGTNSLSSQEMERQVKPPGKRSVQRILDQLQLIDNIVAMIERKGVLNVFVERAWSKNYEVGL